MTQRASIHIKCSQEEKEQYLTLLYLIKAKCDKSMNNIDVLLKSLSSYNKQLDDTK